LIDQETEIATNDISTEVVTAPPGVKIKLTRSKVIEYNVTLGSLAVHETMVEAVGRARP
jgi:hypothetical protein